MDNLTNETNALFELEADNLIQLVGIIVSLLIGIISIIISVITLRQNSKILEESTRPFISVYGAEINSGSPTFYIVVKNFGQSPAVITRFDYDFNFMEAYPGIPKRDYLKDLVNSSLGPDQSKICLVEYDKINSPVSFSVEYKTSTKTYKEHMTIDLKAGTAMLTSKSGFRQDTELRAIAYTLQEMLQKNL